MRSSDHLNLRGPTNPRLAATGRDDCREKQLFRLRTTVAGLQKVSVDAAVIRVRSEPLYPSGEGTTPPKGLLDGKDGALSRQSSLTVHP